jgi:apolipoprotein N-acyltransferase
MGLMSKNTEAVTLANFFCFESFSMKSIFSLRRLSNLSPLSNASSLSNASPWVANSIALIAGGATPLCLAPFNIWPISILSLTVLALLIHQQALNNTLMRCGLFAVGMYGVGVSWVYVSITGFGGAPLPLGILLVSIFTLVLASAFCIPFYIYARWFSQRPLGLVIAFPITWLLSEWLRTWLLTGFPWLFVGYAHVHTWLSGWAPILGVLGLSFICAITAGVIAHGIYYTPKSRAFIGACSLSCLLWIAGALLQHIQWTQASTEPVSIALVQPNMSQEDKWLGSEQLIFDALLEQTETLWNHKIIIWPEAAIPLMYSEVLPFLNEVNRKASDHHAGLITGIIFDDATSNNSNTHYYNSVATFGNAIGIYHKRRLVPFGEYVPFEWLRDIIDFFNLPTSIINIGPQEQHGLKVDDLFISPSVCYEVAYPDLVATSAKSSNLLMSVSNLGWFGDSLGRHQFMQMAQMRALETQRFYAYSTNNGPSAIFDRKGDIQAQTKAFDRSTLSAQVYAVTGSTPFMRWGSLPVIVISVLCLLGFYFKPKRN